MNRNKIPVIREDDGELLGFIANAQGSWTAETIFGYVIVRVETRAQAEMVVRTEGQSVLQGMWRYMDDDKEWYPCRIKKVFENRVVVIRTNELGFQDAENYKLVTLTDPTESVLMKG